MSAGLAPIDVLIADFRLGNHPRNVFIGMSSARKIGRPPPQRAITSTSDTLVHDFVRADIVSDVLLRIKEPLWFAVGA